MKQSLERFITCSKLGAASFAPSAKGAVVFVRNPKNGAPGEIRTPDPLVRSQMLYPAELRARAGILQRIHIVRVRGTMAVLGEALG